MLLDEDVVVNLLLDARVYTTSECTGLAWPGLVRQLRIGDGYSSTQASIQLNTELTSYSTSPVDPTLLVIPPDFQLISEKDFDDLVIDRMRWKS